MKTTTTAMLIAAVLAMPVLAGDPGEALFKKTHRGAKESFVAKKWFEGLPLWVNELTTKKQYPQTHLDKKINEKGRLENLKRDEKPNKFEIREVQKGNYLFMVQMLPDGRNSDGRLVYKPSSRSAKVPLKYWSARFVVETYPVDSNRDDNDLIGFAAWLYDEKENWLANRVLTVVRERNDELKPLIDQYICEKEDWEQPADGLEVWNSWDAEYQKERSILVTPVEKNRLLEEREEAAEDAFDKILEMRGDYKGKISRRRKQPTAPLALIEWEIKQYKRAYSSADFAKKANTVDTLEDILDSIKDDKALIDDNWKNAKDLPAQFKNQGKSKGEGLKAKAELMEKVLRLNPKNLRLKSEVANAWFTYANPAPHGNSCDRSEGCKKAIPHYEELLKVYPENIGLLMAMGRLYQAQEDSKKARPYYERVIELEPDGGNARTAKSLIRNMEMKDQQRGKK